MLWQPADADAQQRAVQLLLSDLAYQPERRSG